MSLLSVDSERAVRSELLAIPGGDCNFKVFVFRTEDQCRGFAVITLPETRVGTALIARLDLAIPAPDGGTHWGRLSHGKNVPSPELVDRLKRQPYRTPDQRRASEGGKARVPPVAFGEVSTALLLRDGSLSTEWIHATPFGQAVFHDFHEPCLRLQLNSTGELRERQIASIQHDQVHQLRVDAPALVVHLCLQQAPVFLLPPLLGNKTPSDRLQAWHPSQACVAPYTSRDIVLRFNSATDLQTFLNGCHNCLFPKPLTMPLLLCTGDNLVKRNHIDAIREWTSVRAFELAFAVEKLLANNILHPHDLHALLRALDISRPALDVNTKLSLVRRLGDTLPEEAINKRPTLDSEAWTEILKVMLASSPRDRLMQREAVRSHLFPIYHIKWTPTGTYLDGPSFEQSNRVIRNHSQHPTEFLKVTCVDEDLEKYYVARGIDHQRFVSERFGHLLKRGFDFAGRHYDLLAWSNSGLKTQDAWFVTPFLDQDESGQMVEVDAESIRNDLGDFSKLDYQPARKAARISQAFSSTSSSLTLHPDNIRKIPDITAGEQLFTDGVGTMSMGMAEDITAALNESRHKPLLETVQAIQFRLGGYKGMLSLKDDLPSFQICIRPSMDKFTSASLHLEVSDCFQSPMAYFLNRPLINILEDLGTPVRPFLRRQEADANAARMAVKSLKGAAQLLAEREMGRAYSVPKLFKLMESELGLSLATSETDQTESIKDEFLESALRLLVTEVLSELKHKARIRVPGSYCLVGIADEYNLIPEGQVFAQVQYPDEDLHMLTGPIAISRSPAVHPGDVQLVAAANFAPKITSKYPKNAVVFSCRGSRSLPSCLGGGDLDGDLYTLLLDETLFPRRIWPAALYPPAVEERTSWPCTIKDMANHFINFMIHDCVARLAILHLRLSAEDEASGGTTSKRCVDLASLHSVAVDFQKTGFAVLHPQIPSPAKRERPDFLAPRGKLTERQKSEYYESKRIVGQLFRAIDVPVALPTRAGQDVDEESWPPTAAGTVARSSSNECIAAALEHKLEDQPGVQPQPLDREFAEALLAEYKVTLRKVCSQRPNEERLALAISEEEAFVGILAVGTGTKRSRQRQARAELLQEQSSLLVLATLNDLRGVTDEDDLPVDYRSRDLSIRRSWACWQLATRDNSFGAATFAWLSLYAILAACKLRRGGKVSD